jgi:putative spermidine/putrescine transport system substrate-binding protein
MRIIPRRSFWAAALAAAALATTAQAQSKTLIVTSYGGPYTQSQREAYYKPFTAQTGIKIQEEEAVEVWPQVRAQVEAGKVTWGVVNGEKSTIEQGCETGLLERFDWSLLDKSKFMPEAVHECGVGAVVQALVLAYDASRIKGEQPKTVADFWDLKKWPGKRALRKSPISTLEFALMADGVPHDKVYETLRTKAGVDRAFRKLDQIKPRIVWWESSSQPTQLLADGEVTLTSSWSGRVSQAKLKDKKNFVIIWDGQNYDIDFWAVVKGSPQKAEAMKFIAFASDPKRQVEQVKWIPYGPTRLDARSLLPKDLAVELPNHPDNLKLGLRNDTQFWAENLEDLNERFQAWLAR